MSAGSALAALSARHAAPGRVVWIGLRPARHAPMVEVEAAAIVETGLAGDRRTRPGPRAVTLIQAEHLPVIAALSGAAAVRFADLRRNIAVAGINLAALRGRVLALGGAEIEITGSCAPCSRMEAALGQGGYAAMRGHGGVTARVLRPGPVRLGDPVAPRPDGAATPGEPPAPARGAAGRDRCRRA